MEREAAREGKGEVGVGCLSVCVRALLELWHLFVQNLIHAADPRSGRA